MEDLSQNMSCVIHPATCFHVFAFLVKFKMPAVKYGSQCTPSDWLLLWRLNQPFQKAFEFSLILVQDAGCESESQSRRQQITSVKVSVKRGRIQHHDCVQLGDEEPDRLIVKGSLLSKTFVVFWVFLPPVGVLRSFLLSLLKISCCLISLIVALPADNNMFAVTCLRLRLFQHVTGFCKWRITQFYPVETQALVHPRRAGDATNQPIPQTEYNSPQLMFVFP